MDSIWVVVSDTTIVSYSAAELEWSKGGLGGTVSDMVALHLYSPPNSAAGRPLIWASSMKRDGIQLFGEPRPC